MASTRSFIKEEAAEPQHKMTANGPKPSAFLKSMKSKSPVSSKRFNKMKALKMPMTSVKG